MVLSLKPFIERQKWKKNSNNFRFSDDIPVECIYDHLSHKRIKSTKIMILELLHIKIL